MVILKNSYIILHIIVFIRVFLYFLYILFKNASRKNYVRVLFFLHDQQPKEALTMQYLDLFTQLLQSLSPQNQAILIISVLALLVVGLALYVVLETLKRDRS